MSPTATHATLTMGRPTFAHSLRMSRRSRASVSSGSAKTSIVSKPISFVMRMPKAVSRPAGAHAVGGRGRALGRSLLVHGGAVPADGPAAGGGPVVAGAAVGGGPALVRGHARRPRAGAGGHLGVVAAALSAVLSCSPLPP